MNTCRSTRFGMAAIGAFCCALALMGVAPVGAQAFPQNPGWTVSAVSTPTNFAPDDHSGMDSYVVTVTNAGDAPSNGNGEPVTITDRLPTGLVAPVGMLGQELVLGEKLSCIGLICTYPGVVAPGDTLTLTVPVDVEPDATQLETNVVTVSGGGAAEMSTSTPTAISSTPSPGFGIASGSFSDTLSNTQAGAHADMMTSFSFNTDGPVTAGGSTEGQLKDTVVDLPVGFAGDPAATPTCSAAQLNENNGFFSHCPLDSQVGTIAVTVGGPAHPESLTLVGPVFNMQPLGGEVARLGFATAVISSNIVVKVRPEGYGLEAIAPNLDSADLEIDSTKVTVWGVPADPNHNLMRGTVCYAGKCYGPEPEFGPVGDGIAATIPPEPFLSNPTECTLSPLTSTIKVDTWQNPLTPAELLTSAPSAEANMGPMTGCERLEFNPSLTAQPTTTQAETPTGLNVGLTLPQTYENPTALATSHLKNVTVALPQGMTVNPSAGAGLGGCTPAQYESETLKSAPGEGCPNDSSLGTVTIETPVLKELATGSVYLATPYDNPFSEEGHPDGSLLAVYVVARIRNRGVLVKVAGKITPNPVTGQLVTTFENNPQLPFDKFTLSFHPGEAAPLVTPPTCGPYTALSEFTSWSEPEQLVSGLTLPFEILHGVGGGECPSGGVPPFAPKVTAGTLDNAAGSYSPFYLRITRNDGEQEITRFSTVLPPGMTGNLTGIPFCPEADIEAARGVTGDEELAHPSCPAASEIGHTLVGAGVGGVLAYTPGKVYLAGPYHGAPLSIVSITSATVGPFDLGTVVIRFALRINPITAQAEIDASGSDPIPHIIRGIVVHVRDIHVYIDRPKFIINPTSCNRMSIAATISGGGADPANPADQVPVKVEDEGQAADCANLAFKPTFKVSTSAHTSRARGASLDVKLTYPKTPQGTEANIARVKVELPKRLPSRLKTLQKACVAATFEANPAMCPATSVVGHAKAIAPIVPVPLEGPAYFVSHGGEAFPSLIVVLQGYGLTVDLVGTTFISKHGITSSTFKTVPDVPVGSFELTLPEGPYSALAVGGNREPLQGQAHDADRIPRAERRRDPPDHRDQGHRLPEAEGHPQEPQEGQEEVEPYAPAWVAMKKIVSTTSRSISAPIPPTRRTSALCSAPAVSGPSPAAARSRSAASTRRRSEGPRSIPSIAPITSETPSPHWT